MKKIITLFLFVIFILTVVTHPVIYAASATPAPTKIATPSGTTIIDKLKQIEILKEKIATKVAELREKEKGGTSGTIKSVGNSTITITTKSGEQSVSYSEDTIFFQMTDGVKSDPIDAKQAKKLKNGDHITALGYFDSAHTTLSAKYIYLMNMPAHFIGKIVDIDKGNYTITVKEPKGNTIVDIETYTKIFSYNKKTALTRGGFSKLQENDTVHIFARPNPKEEDRVSALKIISFTFGGNTSPTPTEEKEASPTAKTTGR